MSMRSAMRKAALREIRGSFGRYFAILAIIALGVGFFSGVRITTPAMVNTINTFLEDHKMYDYRLLSSTGWSDEDAEAFSEADVAEEVGKEKELVISTGGGVIVTPENHDALRQNATVVFINRDIDVLPTDGRPLSQKNNLHEMYKKRLPLYRSICHHEVDGNGTLEEVAERIEALFR